MLKRTPIPWTPHAYQLKAAKFMVSNAVGALFLDMGLGKTASTLAAVKTLLLAKRVKRVLIIAPLRVCYTVWPGEVAKWADFSDLRVEILHGPNKDAALKRDADIYVINPAGLEWLVADRNFKQLDADVLISDESTDFKHIDTQRSKLLRAILPSFRRRYILTGAPAPNGLMDLFGQIYILDQGNALGRYITHYRNSFFDSTGYGGYTWLPKADAMERINERIAPMALRMAAEDYLELPERINNTIKVQLPPKVRKTYKEIADYFITRLKTGEAVTAPSAAAAGIKLRQIANGAMYRNPEIREGLPVKSDGWVDLHDAKLDALEEVVESQQGKPVLLAYEFQHDAARIRKRFPGAIFLADYKGVKINEIVARWNRGDIPLMCAHPASAGHGLNLQGGGNTVCWFSIPWNLDHYDQFNARVLRQGNTHSTVIIHHIIAEDTMDEAIMLALGRKGATQKELLDDLRAYALKEAV